MIVKKIFLGISVVLHFAFFILFYSNCANLDVMSLLGFCYVPITASLILCALDVYLNKVNKSTGYSVINAIYLAITNFFIYNNSVLDKIYENSRKYESENVTISLSSSPIFSLIILIVISFALHMLVVKLMNKGNTKKSKNLR